MTPATFRIVHFLTANRFVGIAWNYDAAILIATGPHETYTLARQELEARSLARDVQLRWFDGEYVCKGDSDPIMVPVTDKHPV